MNSHRVSLSIGLALVLAMSFDVPRSRADWSGGGVALCDTIGVQYSLLLVADGAGGAIAVWQDQRAGTEDDIYSQRVSANGNVLWASQGVALCLAAGVQQNLAIASDGVGGAIAVWQDGRDAHQRIRAQRILASGLPSWAADGVELDTVSSNQFYPAIVSDGVGGAIVAWAQIPGGIHVQRVDAAGVARWGPTGVALCTIENAGSARIASDGAGGAIVVWADARTGSQRVYLRRVSAGGVPQGGPNGTAVATSLSSQYDPKIVSDGVGGAVVTWIAPGIFAQRVDASGAGQWGTGGVGLLAASYTGALIISDAAGGAIVAWAEDFNGGENSAIRAQRINGAGVVQWDTGGVTLSSAPDVQYDPAGIIDGEGGAIIVWSDCCRPWWDTFGQRVDGVGAQQWTAAGVPLSNSANGQYSPAIASDGSGGGIVAWRDRRSGNDDIYAQRVQAAGSVVAVVPGGTPSSAAARAWPNPFSGTVRLAFELSASAPVQLEVFDVEGRRVWASPTRALSAGQNVLLWDGEIEGGGRAAGGIYFLQARGPGVLATRTVVRLR